MNTTPTTPHNLPEPAGAVEVRGWRDPEIAGELYRAFKGSSWVVQRDEQPDDIRVSISGVQFPDGRIERGIFIDGAIDDLTAAQARALARALIAAADEAETMNSYDQITVS
jgi:hypothetical protein